MGKKIGAVLVALAVASLAWYVSDGSSDSDPAAFGGCVDEGLESLEIRIRPSKRTYIVGEEAHFDVKVTRVVKVDENTQSRKVTPVEGAEVVLGVKSKGSHIGGASGITGDEGNLMLTMKLKRQTPSGELDVTALAKKDSADVNCSPYEEGHLEAPGMIKAKARD